MSNFSKVGTFMKTFGQEVKNKPSFSSDKIGKLRIDLIKEELDINAPYIWTAPSLYDSKVTETINQKFLSFCDSVQNIKTENVIELHEVLKSYLPESALKKANGNLRTTSLTHFSNLEGKQKLFYKDILADKRYSYQL